MKFSVTQITNLYQKLPIFGKILLFISLLLILVVIFRKLEPQKREGYTQDIDFLFKSGTDVYDDFYASIYDQLVFNNVKDDYEVGEIINKTTPNKESIILDIGSGTGHKVAKMNELGFQTIGIDLSPSMIEEAKKIFPDYKFLQGDVQNALQFKPSSFTHILCTYFTIYYIKDKQEFFNNCMTWLMPGGYLVIHLVNRDKFDPILPSANPLLIVSPQKYAKERITKSKITFDDFVYEANFELEKDKNIGVFKVKFHFKNSGKTRKQEHKLFMDTQTNILNMAQDAGFIIEQKIDLVNVAYEYQYLYILRKP